MRALACALLTLAALMVCPFVLARVVEVMSGADDEPMHCGACPDFPEAWEVEDVNEKGGEA